MLISEVISNSVHTSKASRSNIRNWRQRSSLNFLEAQRSPNSSLWVPSFSKAADTEEREPVVSVSVPRVVLISSRSALPSPIVEAQASKVESLWAPNCSRSLSPPSSVSATSSLLSSCFSSVSHPVSCKGKKSQHADAIWGPGHGFLTHLFGMGVKEDAQLQKPPALFNPLGKGRDVRF